MPRMICETCWDCGCPINNNLTFWQSINPFFYGEVRCKDCDKAIDKKRELERKTEVKEWLEERKKLIGR